jgi:hypothetical protein
MNNLNQTMKGTEMYKADKDGHVPYPECNRVNGGVRAICTWTYGGKDTSENWVGSNAPFDISASARPLNAYLYPDIVFTPPKAGTFDWDGSDGNYKMGKPQDPRQRVETEAFKSPGDKTSYQTNWPKANYTLSSYDDVGTSYHTNLRWFEVLEPQYGFSEAFDRGIRRIELARRLQTPPPSSSSTTRSPTSPPTPTPREPGPRASPASTARTTSPAWPSSTAMSSTSASPSGSPTPRTTSSTSPCPATTSPNPARIRPWKRTSSSRSLSPR